ALGVDDQAFIEEQVGYLHGGGQQAARVVAQVEHQAMEVLAIQQVAQCLFGIAATLALELGDAQVTVTRLQYVAAHAANKDAIALQCHGARLLVTGGKNRQLDLGTDFAAQQFHRLAQAQALYKGVIDFQDQVAGVDAGLAGWSVINRRYYLDEAVLQRHFNAEATELAAGGDLQVVVLIRCQVGRVRVEFVEHAADRRL